MKNSSRFVLKIERNFTRSRSGVRGSSASCSTRALNASQLSSRFKYIDDDVIEFVIAQMACYGAGDSNTPHRADRARPFVTIPVTVTSRPPQGGFSAT